MPSALASRANCLPLGDWSSWNYGPPTWGSWSQATNRLSAWPQHLEAPRGDPFATPPG